MVELISGETFIQKYSLYYTLNKKLDFEIDENELIEKINVLTDEESSIIFRLIYEHYRFINKTIENDLPTTLPNWIVKEVSSTSESKNDPDNYKINLNDIDLNIKKIIWKFLNLKK